MIFSIGIDIGGTSTRISAVDKGGNILKDAYLQTNEYNDPEEFIADLSHHIERLMAQFDRSNLLGIGIGSPGAQISTGEIAFTANLNWSAPVNIVSKLSSRFATHVKLTNDANLFAIGEKSFGLARNFENFLFITLGTGVGGSAFVNGLLMEGRNGQSTEFGHIIINQGGRPCGCGRRGCLEAYTSALGICITAREKLTANSKSELAHYKVLSAKIIHEAALNNDLVAIQALEDTGRKLGLAVANLVACFDPEAVFLSGGVMNAGDLILKPLKHSFKANLLSSYDPLLPILRSSLPENDAAVLGASALTWNENILETVLQ